MTNVGFTTGSLYRSEIAFDERIKLYQDLGADAIELSFATPAHLFEYQLSEEIIETIKKFSYVSIHAPWKEIRYGFDNLTDQVITKLRFLCVRLPIGGLVLHPDTIDDFSKLEESGLPFLLENMDGRKSYGRSPEDFEELKRKCSFGFVLDIQHLYEYDSSMKIANRFIRVMGDRLKHLHVSGFTESEIHVPAYMGINKDAIVKVLKLGIHAPIVLEGILLEDINNRIKKELEFVRSF